ncbi:MAG: hypothetical protein M1823_005496 [Watsoniomyces obsoletus]|nr:MAG: hypothetical protein M1823_005496 [Watsoniomyces obsoletus]
MAEGELADDGRSSSLSEVDERIVDRPPREDVSVSNADVGENDSEAETERLERSPEKIRKHKDVVVGLGLSHTIDGSPKPLSDEAGDRSVAPDTPGSPTTKTPDALPLAVSIINNGGAVEEPLTAVSMTHETSLSVSKLPTPPEVAGRKRKRPNGSVGALSSSDDAEADEPLKKRTGSVRGDQEHIKAEPNGVTGSPENGTTAAVAEDEPHQQNGADAASPANREASPAVFRTPRKGRRRGGRFVKKSVKEIEERSVTEDVEMQVDAPADDAGTQGGDVEEEAMDAEEEEGTDATAKNEEIAIKRQEAIDALSMVEQHFTAFKDKLYDERLQQLNHELSLLTQPEPTHPEHLAMLQCLDARRDEKIRHEQRQFRYKFNTMERKYVGERSQIHGQYFQTVRDIREKYLDESGELWYTMQENRRQWEMEVDEYLHPFSTRRSTQIKEQRAYNTEVSVLAGVAKFVGFPAAPQLQSVEQGTLQDDLRRMRLS